MMSSRNNLQRPPRPFLESRIHYAFPGSVRVTDKDETTWLLRPGTAIEYTTHQTPFTLYAPALPDDAARDPRTPSNAQSAHVQHRPPPLQIYKKLSCGCDRQRYEKDFIRENPRSPWKSRNQRHSGDQAFDCREDVQMDQKSDARAQFRPSPASASPRTFDNRSGSMSWSQGCVGMSRVKPLHL
jgi:hypothetical protein